LEVSVRLTDEASVSVNEARLKYFGNNYDYKNGTVDDLLYNSKMNK
jgi:hypothetical protein